MSHADAAVREGGREAGVAGHVGSVIDGGAGYGDIVVAVAGTVDAFGELDVPPVERLIVELAD